MTAAATSLRLIARNHDGVIVRHETIETYTATCSCGWTGAVRETLREASADLTQHFDTRADT